MKPGDVQSINEDELDGIGCLRTQMRLRTTQLKTLMKVSSISLLLQACKKLRFVRTI